MGTAAQARRATEATFAYPNAAPQASGFNQSKELWLGLEDHVLAFAEATDQRLSVITAPVLAPEDPPYRGIRIPRRFFKVAAWASSEDERMPRLAAAGFVLDQSQLIGVRQGALAVPALGLGLWLWLGFGITGGWLHAKLAVVALTVGYHHACARLLRRFEAGENRHPHRWYRWFNEAPVLMLLAAVVLVVVKPF